MNEDNALGPYKEKRQFDHTPEPATEERPPDSPQGQVFVVQKHDASRLHYDFRIEVGGVLKSWAVPRGPSSNPADKRLAVPTEDHPLSYADFEGVIPEGNYGAGPVIVWDIGTYRNIKEKNGKEVPMEQTVENGRIAIWLEGKKLRGGYALTRFKKEPDESWLLIKMDDECADPSTDLTTEQPESAISGRTIEDLRRESGDA